MSHVELLVIATPWIVLLVVVLLQFGLLKRWIRSCRRLVSMGLRRAVRWRS